MRDNSNTHFKYNTKGLEVCDWRSRRPLSLCISTLRVLLLVVLAFFLIFVVLLGGVIPRVKGSSSPQENLDNFLTADGQSSLVCISALGHCAYRQDLFIAVPLSRGSCGIDKVPAFFM